MNDLADFLSLTADNPHIKADQVVRAISIRPNSSTFFTILADGRIMVVDTNDHHTVWLGNLRGLDQLKVSLEALWTIIAEARVLM